VWETTVNGRQLHFHLAGINNQNFIMRDEETGSWWQQVTGEAIQGPLKGQKLKPVYHDELTFTLWKQEQPNGRVLRPDEEIAKAGKYAPANWEQRMSQVPVTSSIVPDKLLDQRALIVGVRVNNVAKAYPLDLLRKQNLIIDELAGTPIFLVVGEDGRSVRAFERTVDGRKLEIFLTNVNGFALVDAETGSTWDFTGKATAGQLQGKQLNKISLLNDYWFDWITYNPNSAVYKLGSQ
jgi:hypothetical protein